jgi:hypothetical protein
VVRPGPCHPLCVELTALKGILTDAHVDEDHVGVEVEKPDALCVVPEGERWTVFRCEGAARVEERTFTTENDACVYFLLRALQLYVKT